MGHESPALVDGPDSVNNKPKVIVEIGLSLEGEQTTVFMRADGVVTWSRAFDDNDVAKLWLAEVVKLARQYGGIDRGLN
jgi:hypothetical protein